MFISHAGDEHRDFQMLERDYCAVGGSLEEIVNTPKNIGSEALSAFMFHRASQPDPLDLLGAMFVIEGLGKHKAGRWAEALKKQLKLTNKEVSFLTYHGQNDDNHFDRLRDVLTSGVVDDAVARRIVRRPRSWPDFTRCNWKRWTISKCPRASCRYIFRSCAWIRRRRYRNVRLNCSTEICSVGPGALYGRLRASFR